MIYLICKVLDIILNPAIGVLGLFEAYLLVRVFLQLRSFKARIDKLNGHEAQRVRQVDIQGKQHKNTKTTTFVRDWDEYDDFRNDYQRDSRTYTAFSLIIQLFPLLGILGTVAGLYIAMQGNQDWQSAQGLFEGVRFALSSTVLGIILAVVFKGFDIFLEAWYIGYIEDGIDLFRGNYTEEKDRGA